MVLSCPVCRAKVEVGPNCERCRADLGLLFVLEEQRRRVLCEAYRHLRRGEAWSALAYADHSDGLRRGRDTRRIRMLAHLLRREFAQAWQEYTAGPIE